jgi:chromosome segregation ATPase
MEPIEEKTEQEKHAKALASAAFKRAFDSAGAEELEKSLDSFSAEHARRSRILGEIEENIEKAKATQTQIEKGNIAKRAELTELSAQVRGLKAECDTLSPQRDALKIEVEALRTEQRRHAHDALSILKGEEPRP